MCARACTNRKVGEDSEGAVQKSDQIDQVVAGTQGSASWSRSQPIIISQLKELVDFGVEAGVDLSFSSMTSILWQGRQAWVLVYVLFVIVNLSPSSVLL